MRRAAGVADGRAGREKGQGRPGLVGPVSDAADDGVMDDADIIDMGDEPVAAHAGSGWTGRPGQSLTYSLLWWMLPVLLAGMVVGSWRSSVLLRNQAEEAHDRALAGVVRAIDLNISTAGGNLSLAQPYPLLEFFRLTVSGRVYYRVATEDGLAEIGYAALPMPPEPLPSGELRFFYGSYLDDEPIRVAVLARPLEQPLVRGDGGSGRVIIQVAESLEARERYSQALLKDVILRDVVLLVLLVAVLWAGILLALRPLGRLRDELARRASDDLQPVPLDGIPGEVVPLVQAINGHMQRFASHAARQRQFLDDASHQLRTPLAMLRTKVEYALREPDPQEVQSALAAMRSGLDRAERVTNQMLALARAHDASLAAQARETIELGALLEESVRLLLPAARQKKLDYGLERPSCPVYVQGMRLLLQEAILNLLDNAIKYSRHGDMVLTSLLTQDGRVSLTVQDTGPGMSDEDLAQAGKRFRRGSAGRGTSGAGLGLAIVDAIIQAHQGQMHVQRGPAGQGLQVLLLLPLAGLPFSLWKTLKDGQAHAD